ncbi:hypothetical protein [Streptomyces mesophilus]|uniref:hypothetical protein n=1 Tax=Streptomyces mesophilus TaxID=1775132 RepID=UPI003321DA98
MARVRRGWVAVAAVVVVGGGGVSGCAEEGATAGSAVEASGAPGSSVAPKVPKTAGEFLARAREAMAAEPGWTFTVNGTESLALSGSDEPNRASYTAEGRWTGAPQVLRADGTITSGEGGEGGELRVQSYVVDGTGHFREGVKAWEKGPVTEPENAAKVEDPMAQVASFEEYVSSPADPEADEVRVVTRGDEVRLQVEFGQQSLAGRAKSPALDKAGLEFDPTLAQLKEQGVAAAPDDIVLRDLDEQLVLDARTYQVKSHWIAFSFVLPYQGRQITYTQEVRQEIGGTFAGAIELPAGVR